MKWKSLAISSEGRRSALRACLPDAGGNALVVTLLITLALSGLILGTLLSVQTETRLTSNQSMDEKAFYLAERGVEESIAFISQMGVPLIGSGPGGGGPVALFTDQQAGEGQYSAWADPMDSNTGQASRYVAVTVRSTLDGAGVSRAVRVKLGQENFSRFAYFTDLEHHSGGATIWFITEDEFFGPVHTNDQIHICGSPTFHDEVSSAASTIDYYHGGPPQDDPTFDMGVQLETPTIALPGNTDMIKAKGLEADGYYFNANNVSIELFVDGAGDGKMNVKLNNGAWTEYDIPANGVCYVDGEAHVWGTLNGQLTVCSSGDLEIMDNLIYYVDPRVDPTSDDILGLVSEENIIMDGSPHCANNDVADETVMGALMALKYSFTVENYASGTPRGTLVLYGALIQEKRGPIGTFSGSSGQPLTGYTKDYTFDSRLTDNPPPAFPTTGEIDKIAWEEVDPATDITANYW
jgi:Tfp pilus assembly protein PilX